MLYPSIFGENLFDDLMDFSFPTFRDFGDVDRKLYGKNAARLMKTDVHEHDDQYEIDIDLPGFKKNEITLTLEKGTLTVAASKGLDKDEKTKKGRVIRQERYAGSMQRSFFIGQNVTEDEIKAKYEDGVLKLLVPKKEAAKIPEKKTITIEG
ncbi:MAG: Hsp20/alpha crystallin family protein [Sarcina sp.]|nr:Hsp20/alpha crystallin family protein [Sarcina sp.]